MKAFAAALGRGVLTLYMFGAPWWLLYIIVTGIGSRDLPAWVAAAFGALALLVAVVAVLFTALLGVFVSEVFGEDAEAGGAG